MAVPVRVSLYVVVVVVSAADPSSANAVSPIAMIMTNDRKKAIKCGSSGVPVGKIRGRNAR